MLFTWGFAVLYLLKEYGGIAILFPAQNEFTNQEARVMDSNLFLFYYSIAMQVCAILTAASCFAAFLVSRNKVQLYVFVGFLLYYADCLLVFRDDYIMASKTAQVTEGFYIGDPLLSVVFGCGFLTAFWFVVCDYVKEQRKPLRFAPSVIFVVASILVDLVLPEGYVRMFLFYTLREAFMAWMLLFGAFRYVTAEDRQQRMRLAHFKRFYAVLWLLVIAVVAENVVFLLVVNPSMQGQSLPFFPERNFAENALALSCEFVALRSSLKYLSVRHIDPPKQGGQRVEAFIEQNLVAYAAEHNLTPRETEILRLLLLGKDNQNIASELSLAAGTVKVHVHRILQKTQQANRQELMKDYWNYV